MWLLFVELLVFILWPALTTALCLLLVHLLHRPSLRVPAILGGVLANLGWVAFLATFA